MNPLLQLAECGQSYWMDNLSRKMLHDGELARRIHEDGLRGVTSNPVILHRAITEGEEYREPIQQLKRQDAPAAEIYRRLVVEDVRAACDLFRPVHEESDGVDGFVSLEVSPHLAHDAQGTIAEAERLYGEVDRPNLCVKIPATPAGVTAIEECLYRGLAVNVTLLFDVESYEAVAQAYLRALERRRLEDRPIDRVRSVASVFLSRIDVLVDRLLAHRTPMGGERYNGGPDPVALRGHAAISVARSLHRVFHALFRGSRWQALASRGARVQRPLWASTGVKNPAYRDTLYVDSLIAPRTVTTLPPATIDAFRDHGVVIPDTASADPEGAERVLEELATLGIDTNAVAWQLLNEGIQKFIDPYDALMEHLAEADAPAGAS